MDLDAVALVQEDEIVRHQHVCDPIGSTRGSRWLHQGRATARFEGGVHFQFQKVCGAWRRCPPQIWRACVLCFDDLNLLPGIDRLVEEFRSVSLDN